MRRKGVAAGSGRHRAAGWCPIFVRRCTIGVNAKLPWCLSLFKIHPSSDAPRNEFAGGERGDNRGTKCPDPKALLDGIQQRFFICVHGFPSMVHRPARLPYSALTFAPHFFRASPRPPVFPFPAIRSQTMRNRAPAVRANPVGVRKTRPLHSAFADRTVGKIGRQFSYKQNAEEGVRLDEQRRTMDRGRRGGGCRSFVVGWAGCRRGLPKPFCGL
ncbi:hypothetical protein LMG29660_04459 [Burkholderia puraquae]|uniref:Uncharacterized protein n=1 Tax=Burkholderia puraquae TaxID=1904757 RepID=A0A6J5E7C6_9BURK|nr:hypothetical protein LMG29660_04459 [Burkholderia puraquae]